MHGYLTILTGGYLTTLILASARMAGLLMVAPVFASNAVPKRLRMGIAAVLALAVTLRLGPGLPIGSVYSLVLPMVLELAIGACLGYAARLLVMGAELGALHVSHQMGLGLSELYAPASAEATGTVTGLFRMLAVVLFVVIGGHRQLLAGAMGSFASVPIGSGAVGSGLVNLLAGLLSASFVVALKLAAPMLVAMLLASLAMGAIQRTVPQFNVLSTNLPARAVLGLAVLAATLPAAVWVITSSWPSLARQVSRLLQTMGGL